MNVRNLALCVLMLAGASAPAVGAAPDGGVRSEVPIREVVLSDGVRRYVVTLTIGGLPIDAQIDTGSTGLRILANAVPSSGAPGRESGARYSYGSGVELRGTRSETVLSIGTATGTVPIERVTAVGCTDRKPDCPATKTDIAHYRIGGDGLAGQGFQAIFGTGFRADSVGNPLIALGVRRWIVELPHGGRTGRLVLNPAGDEAARYRSFGVLRDSNQIAACLVRATDRKRICGPAMIDTGASGLRIQGASRDQIWANGTPAVIALGDQNGVAEFAIVVGRREQASGMFAEQFREGSRQITLNLGLAPFFHWSVLFDADARRIGVADLDQPGAS